MDYLEANFVESLLDLKKVGECDIKLLKSSLVYDARNQAAQFAVKEGYDYVLWIDSDMTFDSDLMERMFNSIGDKAFLTGLCFSRRPPFKPCIYKAIDLKKDGAMVEPVSEVMYDYPRDQIVQIEAAGFACVLQKVEMLDVMLSMYGVPFFPIAGLGEDLSFCYRAKQLDYTMYVDTSIKIGHIMRMSVDENFRDNVFSGANNA
jgi:GT2 family glycosyltransferase